MKFLVLALLFTQVAIASPRVILSPVEHLYIPNGFDSNDSVELVVSGSFPNTCYGRNNVAIKFTNNVIDIRVTALAPEASLLGTQFCPQVAIPYKEVISLGNLQGGNYRIRVNYTRVSGLIETLKVGESSSSAVDDHVYAAVEWVESKGGNQFVLHGMKYTDCFKLDRVEVVSNNKDTVSVLPIMKQVSSICPMKGVPTSYPVSLDLSRLKMDKPLIHVRTMDGKSVNSIVDLSERR